MTFHDVCGKFKKVDGIEDAYLLLSEEDNYYICNNCPPLKAVNMHLQYHQPF